MARRQKHCLRVVFSVLFTVFGKEVKRRLQLLIYCALAVILFLNTAQKFLFTAEIPVISASLTKGRYIEGSSVNISCTATGKPDPEVSWIRNGQIKSSGRKIARLNFDQIKRTDDGLYICSANNSAGTKSHKEILVVRCESRIIYYQTFNLNSFVITSLCTVFCLKS